LHWPQKQPSLQLYTQPFLLLSLAMDGFLCLNSTQLKKPMHHFVVLPHLKLYDIIWPQIASTRHH
jgi:hypothetical protein